MSREPHQMQGSELRTAKQELENRLGGCDNDRERQELARRIEELDAELRRRSQIGRGRSPSDLEASGGGQNPSDRSPPINSDSV